MAAKAGRICDACLVIAHFLGWYYINSLHLLGFFTIFLLSPLYHFLLTPIMTLSKTYQYLTPMLLVYQMSDEKYDLHMGTSFDYFMVMRRLKPGREVRNTNLYYLLQGLLIIIDRIERGELPATVEVRGSSYFFSDRTAERMGFTLHKTGFAEKANLVFNYLELLWTYSFSQGKLSFPNLNDIKTATTSGARLLEHKLEIRRLYDYMSKRVPEHILKKENNFLFEK